MSIAVCFCLSLVVSSSSFDGTCIALDRSAIAVDDSLPAGSDISLRIDNGAAGTSRQLVGRDARIQLIVTAELSDGSEQDYTHQVTYSAVPEELVRIDHAHCDAAGQRFDGRSPPEMMRGMSPSPRSKSTASETICRSAFPVKSCRSLPSWGATAVGATAKWPGKTDSGFHCWDLSRVTTTNIWSKNRADAASLRRHPITACCFKKRSMFRHTAAASDSKKDSTSIGCSAVGLLRACHSAAVTSRLSRPSMSIHEQRRLHAQGDQQLSVVATYSDGSVEDVTRAARVRIQ